MFGALNKAISKYFFMLRPSDLFCSGIRIHTGYACCLVLRAVLLLSEQDNPP